MNNLNELKEIAKNCTILVVEDDDVVRDFLNNLLSGLFRRVILAENGKVGLDKFRKNKIDLIISDYMMPVMTGIEMIKEIRKTDTKIPILFATAYADPDVLIEAINSGVTQFIIKPVKVDNILNAIEIAIQRVIVESQKAIQQEAELLIYKEKYHSLQERLTLKKQQKIIKNDLYYKRLDIIKENETTGQQDKNVTENKKIEWLINIKHQPFDILSGDFYSIRKIDKDRVLFYLADAMGKGLSAFVTTAITTSFVNYIVDIAIQKSNFNFNNYIMQYLDFAKQQLIDDEALCALFLYIDFNAETIDIANFSMPPVLIEMENGEILKISSNNLPIMKFLAIDKKDKYNISGFKKILLCSDGLFNEQYHGYVTEDFKNSPSIKILYNKFIERVKSPDDDITFVFIRRFDFTPIWTKDFVVQCRLEKINKLITEIEDILTSEGFEVEFSVEFISAISELLMNAYEHGCLGIDFTMKNKFVQKKSQYEEYLIEKEKLLDKKIMVTLSAFQESERNFLMARITDEGHGFDTTLIKETITDIEMLNYRGIKITKGLVDEIHYNAIGNEVTILKSY